MAWDPTAPGSTAQADNQYSNNPVSTLLAYAARTTSGNTGNTGVSTGGADSVALELVVSAVSGTTPSVTVSMEWSNDGTNWGAADPADAFPAMTAAGRRFKNVTAKGRFMRFVWAISGTTPSLTFAVNGAVIS